METSVYIIRIHHAYSDGALLIHMYTKASHTEYLITIIPCYVISKKFPRLLAEREIIANALFTNDVLEMACTNSNGKGTTKY